MTKNELYLELDRCGDKGDISGLVNVVAELPNHELNYVKELTIYNDGLTKQGYKFSDLLKRAKKITPIWIWTTCQMLVLEQRIDKNQCMWCGADLWLKGVKSENQSSCCVGCDREQQLDVDKIKYGKPIEPVEPEIKEDDLPF